MSDKSVSFVVVATGAYMSFVRELAKSIKQTCPVDYDIHIFTDYALEEKNRVIPHHIKYEGFPADTFKKYACVKHVAGITDKSHVALIDADMLFNEPYSDSVFTDKLTVCAHLGYKNVHPRNLPYSRNARSAAYVERGDGEIYCHGAFWTIPTEKATHICDACIKMKEHDDAIGIEPIWHDESILNRYVIDNDAHIIYDFIGMPGWDCPLIALDKPKDIFKKNAKDA